MEVVTKTMTKIQMVDLQGQYHRIKNEIDSAVLKIIENASFINGPEVKIFQHELEKYLDVKHVIPCGNGTDALQIALMALDLKPGDEVIAPAFTYVATAEVVELLKLKLVYVDVDPRTFNISADAVLNAISPKTKAIIPVHLYGQCADMESIMKIARENSLYVIEDAAQALGAVYAFSDGEKFRAGSIGDIGCTSFFPSKNLGCYGDGGAMYTNNDQLAAKLRLISNHGQSKKYSFDSIGVNSRLDTIQAAILNIKLKYLDEYSKCRNKVADYYDHVFSGHPNLLIPLQDQKSTHVFHQYTLITKGIDRNGLIQYLQKQDIPSMVYYPIPMHLQKGYSHLGYKEGDFPVSEDLCSRVISLPMHTELDTKQLEYISDAVLEYCKIK
jgi:dTDP-4-amino-4,6-dideoxygalactose transaminase